MLQMVDWVVGLSNDSQLLMFGSAAGAFEIAADAHDAGLVVLGLAIWCLESWLMLMMLGLLFWEEPLVSLESQRRVGSDCIGSDHCYLWIRG